MTMTNDCDYLYAMATTQVEPLGGAVPIPPLRRRLLLALDHADLPPSMMEDELGVSRQTIGNYLAGRTHPSRAVLRVWAMRCGVSLVWLSTGRVGPTSEDGSSVTLWYPTNTQVTEVAA